MKLFTRNWLLIWLDLHSFMIVDFYQITNFTTNLADVLASVFSLLSSLLQTSGRFVAISHAH